MTYNISGTEHVHQAVEQRQLVSQHSTDDIREILFHLPMQTNMLKLMQEQQMQMQHTLNFLQTHRASKDSKHSGASRMVMEDASMDDIQAGSSSNMRGASTFVSSHGPNAPLPSQSEADKSCSVHFSNENGSSVSFVRNAKRRDTPAQTIHSYLKECWIDALEKSLQSGSDLQYQSVCVLTISWQKELDEIRWAGEEVRIIFTSCFICLTLLSLPHFAILFARVSDLMSIHSRSLEVTKHSYGSSRVWLIFSRILIVKRHYSLSAMAETLSITPRWNS